MLAADAAHPRGAGPRTPYLVVLEATWAAGEFLGVITDGLVQAQQRGGSATWALSSHDAAPRRTRAVTLLMLALPGSACLSQGEDLGPALRWRRTLQAAEHLEWMPGTNGDALHFGRPGGWRSVTNLGPRPVPLPPGPVIVASAPLQAGLLPADTTAWIIPAPMG